MKSQEFHKIMHKQLGNPLKECGMNKGRLSRLSYMKQVDNEYLIFWFQLYRYGWDNYSGSKFCINVQKSGFPGLGLPSPDDFEKLNPQDKMLYTRIPHFFTQDELEEAFKIQNHVISTIPKPPQSYVDEMISMYKRNNTEWAINIFLDAWALEDTPYRENQDIWFRYFTEEHIKQWAHFLLVPLKRTLLMMEDLSVNELNERLY